MVKWSLWSIINNQNNRLVSIPFPLFTDYYECVNGVNDDYDRCLVWASTQILNKFYTYKGESLFVCNWVKPNWTRISQRWDCHWSNAKIKLHTFGVARSSFDLIVHYVFKKCIKPYILEFGLSWRWMTIKFKHHHSSKVITIHY